MRLLQYLTMRGTKDELSRSPETRLRQMNRSFVLERRYSIGFWGEETGFFVGTYPRFSAKIPKKPGF